MGIADNEAHGRGAYVYHLVKGDTVCVKGVTRVLPDAQNAPGGKERSTRAPQRDSLGFPALSQGKHGRQSMSQEILDKLDELKAEIAGLKTGQESLQAGQESLQAGQESLQAGQAQVVAAITQSNEATLGAISAVREATTNNSSGIARLARMLERIASTEDSGPRAATG